VIVDFAEMHVHVHAVVWFGSFKDRPWGRPTRTTRLNGARPSRPVWICLCGAPLREIIPEARVLAWEISFASWEASIINKTLMQANLSTAYAPKEPLYRLHIEARPH